MNEWPKYPTVYEINTWAWLTGLSGQAPDAGGRAPGRAGADCQLRL
jgi:hypothetical protein